MSEPRKLTPEEMQELANNPHFRMGMAHGMDMALNLAMQGGIKFTILLELFEKAFTTHPLHDYHKAEEDESGQGTEPADDTTSEETAHVPDEQGLPEDSGTTQGTEGVADNA
jgi:hypothetical protein